VDKKQIKIIFLHGNGNSTPEDNWFPYLKQELQALGLTVVARQFPDTDLARSCYWLPFLKDELEANQFSILVGHSSGAIAAMRFAEENKVFASILIGAYYTDLGYENEKASGYFDDPWQWDAIKNNQKWIVQFASKDDAWIPVSEPRFIHEQLDSEYHEFEDQGHFDNKTTFPQLVAVIKNKLRL